MTREVIDKIKESLESSASFTVEQNSNFFDFNVIVDPQITMIDGKVTNDLIKNIATLRCPVCLNTFKGFSNIGPGDFCHDGLEDRLRLALNPLHSQIKLFDFIKNLSQKKAKHDYLQKNPAASKGELAKHVKNVKSNMEREFWKKAKAQIDVVKPGYGTSTTGPNVLRAIEDSSVCSEILHIDRDFLESIRYLCFVLRSKQKPDEHEWKRNVELVYRKYKKYFIEYSSLPLSIHKIIVHG